MTVRDSRGKVLNVRHLIDSLRDHFILAVDEVELEGMTLPIACAVFDKAVSDTLLDILDAPAPPSRRRVRGYSPAVRKALDAAERAEQIVEPIVARPPRRRRGAIPPGLKSAAEHAQQMTVDEVAAHMDSVEAEAVKQ